MEIALTIISIITGTLIGIVAYDFSERRADKKARVALKEELQLAAAGLYELQNKNAESMRQIQDKVNAHGVALTMRGK